ncbi:MAG TPA: adenosylhomocysteinase [Actinomycetota bacterium]|nr:adenosylhomocysteinase [Actinomycetota bacterium]
MESMLKDRSLAPEGRLKIEFAGRTMPVLDAVRAEFEAAQPLKGMRIAGCLHVTTETANLVRALVAGGAEVSVAASNPLSTKDDVAAAIAEDFGAHVYAIRGCDRDTYYKQIEGALSINPTVIVDDGADLTTTLHKTRTDLLDDVVGGTEVTSTGVLRLRNMARDGALRYPMVALNDADTKHLFDNRYGTGQNTIDGILRATNRLLAGSVFVVVGYGWCGRGVAMRARGMGARVVVCEVDPLKVLEAVMEGYEVLPIAEAARIGDFFVTVTGNRDAITLEHLESMKSGAIVCNSGHFDLEIQVEPLRARAVSAREVRDNAVEYVLPSGRNVVLLAEGRLVGQAAAEAHPSAVMDMTFSTQALAIEHLVANEGTLEAGVHSVPRDIDDRVARHKLAALGVRHDDLSDEQRDYLSSWELGT